MPAIEIQLFVYLSNFLLKISSFMAFNVGNNGKPFNIGNNGNGKPVLTKWRPVVKII